MTHSFPTLRSSDLALHVDSASPGDDVLAATGTDSRDRLRGTSFAAPLVAGRLALRYPAPAVARIGPAIAALVLEARDLARGAASKSMAPACFAAPAAGAHSPPRFFVRKIGRAYGRDSVCLSVQLQVVDGSLNKN